MEPVNLVSARDEIARRARQQAALAELGQAALSRAGVGILVGQTCAVVEWALGASYVSIVQADCNELSLRFGIAPGEAASTRAGEDRQVVLGKIRDVITRLNESDAQLEKTKQRLNAMTTKDRRLVAQVDRYQKSIAELKATVERQQAEYMAIIDSQNTQIVALRTDLDTVSAARTRVETERAALVDTMNTVYYIAGTQDELIERGNVNGRRKTLERHRVTASFCFGSERLYRYSITESPLPISDYVAEIRVKDNGDGTSTVEWSSDSPSFLRPPPRSRAAWG